MKNLLLRATEISCSPISSFGHVTYFADQGLELKLKYSSECNQFVSLESCTNFRYFPISSYFLNVRLIYAAVHGSCEFKHELCSTEYK